MKVVTVEQIRELDRRAMAGQEPDGAGGIPGAVLMENAGRAVVEVIKREYGPLKGKRIAVFCGSGNNGGDGYVIARYLHLAGARPIVWPVGNTGGLEGDAKVHFELLLQNKVGVKRMTDPESILIYENTLDLIVDAMLGTGIKDAPRDPYSVAIRNINSLPCPIIAVDIPSGVDADTGATPGKAVQATHTITFGYPKLGLFLPPGNECVGKLHVANIGYDWETLNVETPYRLITSDDLRRDLDGTGLLKPRHMESNKGDFGHVAIVAGSRGMVGAPALVARGAQRAGAGLVTVLTAESAQSAIAVKLDEQMTKALPESDGSLSEASFDEISKSAEKASVLCIGPGITTHEETAKLVCRLVAEIEKPIVLDADGLNILAQNPDALKHRKLNPLTPLVLTPHPGEAARLLNKSVAEIQASRIESVTELARRFHAVAVLKGRYTLIADETGQVRINTSGNPGMATGGMGDTLTGIVGGLLSQWAAPLQKNASKADGNADNENKNVETTLPAVPLDVVALGVHLHGLAGDLAAGKESGIGGEAGLVAGDVIAHLPAALQTLKETR